MLLLLRWRSENQTNASRSSHFEVSSFLVRWILSCWL